MSPRSRAGVLVAAGTAGSAGLVVGATAAGWGPGVATPAGPLGLWRPAPAGGAWFAALAAVSVLVLTVAFVRLYRGAVRGEVAAGTAGWAAVLWCLPVLPAPPLLSLDAYSYAAQGTMLLSGLDPYAYGPAALGDGPLLDAVAPVWRATPVPYGPLTLLVLRAVAAAGGGDLPTTVYLLRLVALATVAAAAVVAVRLAGQRRRAVVVCLVAANPLVVVHLIGGVHPDALLAALGALAVLAVHRRWWALAAVAAATALAVKLPGLLVVGYVLIARVRAGGMDRRGRVPAGVAATAAVLAATTAGFAALVPNGWGWLDALDVPGRIRHPYDPATVLSWLLYLTTPAGAGDALAVARRICAVGGSLLALVLLWRAGGEGSARRAAAALGGALAVVALAGPTVHAWYLAWGLALVAAGAAARWRHRAAGLAVALCFTAMPHPLPHRPLGIVLTLVLLVAVAVAADPARAAATPGRLAAAAARVATLPARRRPQPKRPAP